MNGGAHGHRKRRDSWWSRSSSRCMSGLPGQGPARGWRRCSWQSPDALCTDGRRRLRGRRAGGTWCRAGNRWGPARGCEPNEALWGRGWSHRQGIRLGICRVSRISTSRRGSEVRGSLLGPGRRAGTNAGVAWTQVQESCGGARLSWGGQAGATGGGVGASWSACRTEVIVASTRG